MGYYVTLQDADFIVPREAEERALQALKDLNKRDDLKTGGRWSGGAQTEKWFAWMPADYDQTVTSVREVLELLGFSTKETDAGTVITDYDSKTGAEEHFLRALAPFVKEGSYVEWLGEDGERWRFTVKDGNLVTATGRTVWMI